MDGWSGPSFVRHWYIPSNIFFTLCAYTRGKVISLLLLLLLFIENWQISRYSCHIVWAVSVIKLSVQQRSQSHWTGRAQVAHVQMFDHSKWCIEQSTNKVLVIEYCKPISEFAQIYQFLVLLGRKQGLLGIGVAHFLFLIICKHIRRYEWARATNVKNRAFCSVMPINCT